MSPPGNSGGGACHHNRPRPTTAENAAAAAKKLQVHPESTTARRQAWRAALPRQRTKRVQELRRSLDGARRRGDHDQAARICAWLDAEFVADAHRRVVDRDVVRLRRQLRERAA